MCPRPMCAAGKLGTIWSAFPRASRAFFVFPIFKARCALWQNPEARCTWGRVGTAWALERHPARKPARMSVRRRELMEAPPLKTPVRKVPRFLPARNAEWAEAAEGPKAEAAGIHEIDWDRVLAASFRHRGGNRGKPLPQRAPPRRSAGRPTRAAKESPCRNPKP